MTSGEPDTDVLVIGSGAAGLVAALAARAAGARVTIIERADVIGGTTAMSAGVAWVPNNHHMRAAGLADSREDAITYITRLADGRGDERAIAAFVDTAPQTIDFLEQTTALQFKILHTCPDYYAEFAGGRVAGRSLDCGLFDTNELGPWKQKLRKSPIYAMAVMSVTESFEWKAAIQPANVPFDLVRKRLRAGYVGHGAALIGQLVYAALDRGVELMLGTRAEKFTVEGQRVTGAVATHSGRRQRFRAGSGTILASGGFEWDRALCAQFLGGVLTHPVSAPSNEGDGLRMLMGLGTALANTAEAWWCPTVAIPGEQYDGKPLYRGEFTMRALPHTVVVNRGGERFVNEANNYNDLMKAFFRFDPTSYERPNLPAWLLFDSNFVEKYPCLTSIPGKLPPPWIARAATLTDLAHDLGIDPEPLAATVARFNKFAITGVDADFARGRALYDRVFGDPLHQPNACLGPLEKPPFYALQLQPGALGTKGGARIDAHARVLRPDGEPLPGLYAAGNIAAGWVGAGYPGAGTTIASAMTFGFIAGRHAACLPPALATDESR